MLQGLIEPPPYFGRIKPWHEYLKKRQGRLGPDNDLMVRNLIQEARLT